MLEKAAAGVHVTVCDEGGGLSLEPFDDEYSGICSQCLREWGLRQNRLHRSSNYRPDKQRQGIEVAQSACDPSGVPTVQFTRLKMPLQNSQQRNGFFSAE
ncbi:hypothetical protein [Rhizobium yanglingense]